MANPYEIALIVTARTQAAIDNINKFTNATLGKMDALGKKMSKSGENMMKNGMMNVAGGLAIAAPLKMAIDTASQFQDKMIDIRKQMSQDTPAAVAKMTAAVMDSAKKIPLAVGEIQDLYSSGLRMGISEKDIAGFAQQAAKMSVAFDISAGQISEDMAGIGKAFRIPIPDIGKLGDTINYLDDNTLAKGGDIIDVMKRTAGTAKFLSDTQNAALSSTLLTLQEVPERAGTAINSMVNTLAAAGSQSKKSQMAMRMLGFDPQTLQRGMITNAQGTMMAVLDRINSMPVDQQQGFIYRIFGKEFTPTINKLTANMGEYRHQLAMVNGAQKGSMDREYQKRLQSASAQYQILKNRATEFGVRIGNTLLPQITALMQKMGPTIDKILNWVNANPKLIAGLLKLTAGVAAAKIGMGYLQFTFGSIIKSGGGLISFIANYSDNMLKLKNGVKDAQIAFRNFSPATKLASMAISEMGVTLLASPITWYVAAIMALVGVVYLIYKYWEPIKGFFAKIWQSIKNIFGPVIKVIMALLINFTPVGLVYKYWEPIKGFFSKIWEGIKMAFMVGVGLVGAFLVKFTPAGYVYKHWAGIKKWFSDKWDAVKGVFTGFVDWISNSWVGRLVKAIGNAFKSIKNTFSFASSHSLDQTVNYVHDATANAVAKPFMQSAKPAPPIARNNNSQIHYSPTIQISGGATEKDAQKINEVNQTHFDRMIKNYQRNQARVAF